jgi:prepilin-type N-terminal cleavage/methylation domain-containing protein
MKPASPPTSRSPACSAFTLVEMLVVIGIISVLLVAVIPAVNSLSKSNGRKAAISNLLGVIEQARAQAIKDGQPTYVVFPTFSAGTQATLDRYNYKSFAIFEDDPANPNTPKQLTPWKTLPTGVSLRADSTSGQAVTNLSDLAAIVTTIPPFTVDTGSTPVFRCIKFNADGGTDDPAVNFTLAVFEGLVNGTSETATSRPMVVETLSISHLTGRAVHNT